MGPGPGGWHASPSDVVKALADVNDAVAAFAPDYHGKSDGGLGALIEAENKLATARCPELATELDAAKAAAKASADKALAVVPAGARRNAVSQGVAAALAKGDITEAQAALLDHDQQLALLRESTAGSERAGLMAVANQRGDRGSKSGNALEERREHRRSRARGTVRSC